MNKNYSSTASKPINIRWISHTEKICIVSYYIQFSTDIKMYKNKIVLLARAFGISGLTVGGFISTNLNFFQTKCPLILDKKLLLFWQSNINIWLKIAFSDRKINLIFCISIKHKNKNNHVCR